MWYMVLSRDLGLDAAKQTHRDAHATWLDDQHRAGRALFSGPTADGRYGMYVLLAPNLDAARALAGEDPYHQHGVRELEQVLEWDPRRAMRLAGPSIAELTALATDGGPR
ncbi:MAG TPA: YciI family protein [Chloroflexota bacterium]|nr:YciI family protein [Chloroflexota bacterium]